MDIKKEDFIKDYSILTYEELAKKYHISISTVRNIVKELGLSKPTGRRKQIRIV